LTFQHTPTKPTEEVDAIISEFLDRCRPRMQVLVKNANHVPSLLPSWKPNTSIGKLAEHISGLAIPIVRSGQPSLLLHDLGEEKDDLDKDRIARIPDIFSFGYHTCVTSHLMDVFTDLVIPGYSSTPPDLEKLGYFSMVCVVDGDSISLQGRIMPA
jgi:hypothetical protein